MVLAVQMGPGQKSPYIHIFFSSCYPAAANSDGEEENNQKQISGCKITGSKSQGANHAHRCVYRGQGRPDSPLPSTHPTAGLWPPCAGVQQVSYHQQPKFFPVTRTSTARSSSDHLSELLSQPKPIWAQGSRGNQASPCLSALWVGAEPAQRLRSPRATLWTKFPLYKWAQPVPCSGAANRAGGAVAWLSWLLVFLHTFPVHFLYSGFVSTQIPS